MTASPPPPDPPLIRCLRQVREILERDRRRHDVRNIEQAIERIGHELHRAEREKPPAEAGGGRRGGGDAPQPGGDRPRSTRPSG